MAESVDALVSNTSGATHPGSSPGLGTKLQGKDVAIMVCNVFFLFGLTSYFVQYKIINVSAFRYNKQHNQQHN